MEFVNLLTSCLWGLVWSTNLTFSTRSWQIRQTQQRTARQPGGPLPMPKVWTQITYFWNWHFGKTNPFQPPEPFKRPFFVGESQINNEGSSNRRHNPPFFYGYQTHLVRVLTLPWERDHQETKPTIPHSNICALSRLLFIFTLCLSRFILIIHCKGKPIWNAQKVCGVSSCCDRYDEAIFVARTKSLPSEILNWFWFEAFW